MIPPFETQFAVPLSCESCIKEVSTSLYNLDGITKVDADLKEQLVSITGSASPSSIVATIQSTGRDAILRGSGAPNSAAVCILETHSTNVKDRVRGLVRLVQVSPNITIVDLTIRGLSPGTYWATIRETGDISNGAASTGGIWGETSTGAVWDAIKAKALEKMSPRGVMGTVEVGKNGVGSVFLDKHIQVWEMIGRSMVVSKIQDGTFEKEDENTLVGVIARSAGVWENNKVLFVEYEKVPVQTVKLEEFRILGRWGLGDEI